MYIVCVGAPFESQTFYGPFATFEDAADWSDKIRNEYTWIMSLLPSENL